MKRFSFLTTALLTLVALFGFASLSLVHAADSGAVSEGRQTWDGLKIFLKEGVRDATLTGADTLTLDSLKFQRLNGGLSHRDVTLPAATQGLWYFIWNVGSTNDLVVKDAAAATIVTINEGKVGWVAVTTAGAWKGVEFGAAFSGGLLADGTVAGATGQAQDFGTNGIKADVVAESTGATGVTIDGVLLKDTTVDVNGTADAIILDSDGNTTISAPTDNQIDIEINNADDFRFTANVLNCLSGSSIETDTINEETAATGVTIDGVLLKDGFVGIKDTGGDHRITLKTGTDEAADYDLTIPDLAASDTIVTLATTQTITGVKTMSGANVIKFANTGLTLNDAGSDHVLTLKTATDEAAAYDVIIPDLAGNDTLMTLATAQTVTGVKTMSGANVIKFANTGLTLNDAGSDHTLNLKTSTDEAGNYDVIIPDLAGNDTLMTLATAQTVTGVKTMSGANVITHANASGLKFLDTGGDHTIAFITATNEAADYTLTVPDLAASDTLMTLAVPGTVTGNVTFSGTVTRASQRYQYSIAGGKVGGTAGFVLNAASNIFAATVPASTTGAKFVIPIPHLKTGDVITAFGLLGQIESAGNGVTVDADLRGSVTAAGDFTDGSLSTMTQISVTADTAVDSTQDKTGLSITVAQTTQYYIVVTVTTNASTDFDLRGISVVVTEK